MTDISNEVARARATLDRNPSMFNPDTYSLDYDKASQRITIAAVSDVLVRRVQLVLDTEIRASNATRAVDARKHGRPLPAPKMVRWNKINAYKKNSAARFPVTCTAGVYDEVYREWTTLRDGRVHHASEYQLNVWRLTY